MRKSIGCGIIIAALAAWIALPAWSYGAASYQTDGLVLWIDGGTKFSTGNFAINAIARPAELMVGSITPPGNDRLVIHGPVEFDGPVYQKGGGDKLIAQQVPEHVVESTVYQPIQVERVEHVVEHTDPKPLEVALLMGASICLFTAFVGFKLGGRVERYRYEHDLPRRK